jgi:hypothetical protein
MPDTADVRGAIDNGTLRDVYSSIEGAIIHGGVLELLSLEDRSHL